MLDRIIWVAWWLGTIVIVLSWMKIIPNQIGWIGFIVSGLATLISVFSNRYWSPPTKSEKSETVKKSMTRKNNTLSEKISTISNQFKLGMIKADAHASKRITSSYQNSSLIESLNEKWFKQPTLLNYSQKYSFCYEKYDDDGLPSEDSINYVLGFADLNTIAADEELDYLCSNGFFQIAYTSSGDYLLIDMESTDYQLGLVNHSKIWEKDPNIRKSWSPCFSFETLLDKIINNKPLGF